MSELSLCAGHHHHPHQHHLDHHHPQQHQHDYQHTDQDDIALLIAILMILEQFSSSCANPQNPNIIIVSIITNITKILLITNMIIRMT